MSSSENQVRQLITKKIIFLGREGSGKTNLIRRLVNQPFIKKYNPTIDVDFFGRDVPENNIRLQLWDGGSLDNQYSSLRFFVGKKIDLNIIIIDITNSESLKEAKFHLDKAKQNCPNVPVLITTTKIDLEPEREVSEEAVKQFMIVEGLEGNFLGTSALEDRGTNKLLETILNLINPKKENNDLISPSKKNTKNRPVITGCLIGLVAGISIGVKIFLGLSSLTLPFWGIIAAPLALASIGAIVLGVAGITLGGLIGLAVHSLSDRCNTQKGISLEEKKPILQESLKRRSLLKTITIQPTNEKPKEEFLEFVEDKTEDRLLSDEGFSPPDFPPNFS